MKFVSSWTVHDVHWLIEKSLKSQTWRLLFIEQYINSSHKSQKREKKRKKRKEKRRCAGNQRNPNILLIFYYKDLVINCGWMIQRSWWAKLCLNKPYAWSEVMLLLKLVKIKKLSIRSITLSQAYLREDILIIRYTHNEIIF